MIMVMKNNTAQGKCEVGFITVLKFCNYKSTIGKERGYSYRKNDDLS